MKVASAHVAGTMGAQKQNDEAEVRKVSWNSDS